MSPASPVFHTVVTVRIGLKTQLEWEHPFNNKRCIFIKNQFIYWLLTYICKVNKGEVECAVI